MRILMINARNDTDVTHSRKGMYAPLGILSVASYVEHALDGRISIRVIDEDVELLNTKIMDDFDVVGFYSTTFNYSQSLKYAKIAHEAGKKTVFAGPHPTALIANILRNQSVVDYVIINEGEITFTLLIQHLLNENVKLEKIPNLGFKETDGTVHINTAVHTNDLFKIPYASRKFINHEKYIENFRDCYPEQSHYRHGSVFTSKGCAWRDKTNGGCVFCARHEVGMRFRSIEELWNEVRYLKEEYDVNYVWDASDDTLNDKDWFIEFVKKRPSDLQDISWLIYSRVTPINKALMPYFHELNVDEVYLGVESGDTGVLKSATKGQSPRSIRRAIETIANEGIRFFPSFVLALPNESEASLENTVELVEWMVQFETLNRASATVLMPIPGSPAWFKCIDKKKEEGIRLDLDDVINLPDLEKYWAQHFCDIEHAGIVEYKNKIDELMSTRAKTFGDANYNKVSTLNKTSVSEHGQQSQI
jgi:radical SAM superfamily enzyme YgiQ (UPF0313 family)